MNPLKKPLMALSIEYIPIVDIDAQDRTFSVSPRQPVSRSAGQQSSAGQQPLELLVQSVRKVGIVSPLRLWTNGRSAKKIISGFRRYHAARQLGLATVPCILSSENDKRKLFLEALLENLATRPLHELEKAVAVQKLHRDFGLEEQALIHDLLPLLGIRADRYHLRYYLNLSGLPDNLQKAVADSLHPDIALKLAGWQNQEQDVYLALVRRHELGQNKQKDLFNLLDELREQLQLTVLAICQTTGEANGYDTLMEKLQGLRFPQLAEHQKRYQELKSALRLPPSVQFQIPPFFEGERISVAFSFKDPEELRTLAQKLREVAATEQLKEILKLL